MSSELVTTIKAGPHWRVVLRPGEFVPNRLKTLTECYSIIQQTNVKLRGWSFPRLSHRDTERGQGPNWIASWSDFEDHKEYWRLYQSGQFAFIALVRETSPRWREKLVKDTKSHLFHRKDINVERIPGFFSIPNFVYNVTEYFEFATRLCQKGIYRGEVSVTVQLHNIEGFTLTTNWDRSWDIHCAATTLFLGKTWRVAADELVADSASASLSAVCWFFERFGWIDPNIKALKKDQEELLKSK